MRDLIPFFNDRSALTRSLGDQLEHKIPLSCGGTNEYNNLAVACRSCNSSKGAKTTQEYMLYKVEVLK